MPLPIAGHRHDRVAVAHPVQAPAAELRGFAVDLLGHRVPTAQVQGLVVRGQVPRGQRQGLAAGEPGYLQQLPERVGRAAVDADQLQGSVLVKVVVFGFLRIQFLATARDTTPSTFEALPTLLLLLLLFLLLPFLLRLLFKMLHKLVIKNYVEFIYIIYTVEYLSNNFEFYMLILSPDPNVYSSNSFVQNYVNKSDFLAIIPSFNISNSASPA